MRVLVFLLAVVGAAGVVAAPAGAQVARARFDIQDVGDSTFTFSIGTSHWVSVGKTGIAVDPAQGDELIAKFRVMSVHHGLASAVITGQTARVTVADVAVIRIPHPEFFKDPLFWVGAIAGGVIGVFLHRL